MLVNSGHIAPQLHSLQNTLDDDALLDNVADDQENSHNGGQFLCIVGFHISGFGYSMSSFNKN